MKLFLTIFLFFIQFIAGAQQKPEKFFYRDTIFEFDGFKIEVKKSYSNDNIFKSTIVFTNTTDQFIIVNPSQIVETGNGAADVPADGKKNIVVPPHFTKAVGIKFINKDFRFPTLSVNVKSLQLTDKVESVLEINDFDIYNQTTKANGPITFTLVKVVQNPKKPQDNLRIDGIIQYTGNKFLGVFYNNLLLKTNDGKSYVNESKSSGPFSIVKNKFYYDNTKPQERQTFTFPVESGSITTANAPKLYFNEVFKEYSLVSIEGFSFRLKQCTEAEFKGSKGDPDIEEAE